jgi:dTDP-glucose 4,6-dehydratase
VYGDPQEHPQKETYWGHVNPIGLRSCYDEGKRAAEALFMDYHRQNRVDIRLVRIFNTYGPRMALDDGRVVPNFVGQALRHEPLTVYGDGKQTRSFTYVEDLVEGIYRLLMSNEHDPVNLGNPDTELTMLALATMINTLADNPAGIVFKDLRSADDPQVRRPDIAKARRILSWEPRFSAEDGMARTIQWFEEKLSGERAH